MSTEIDPSDLCERSEQPHEELARERVFFFWCAEPSGAWNVLLSLSFQPAGVIGEGDGATPLPSGSVHAACWECSGGLKDAAMPTPFTVRTLEQARAVAFMLKEASGQPWEVRGESRADLAARIKRWAESEAEREGKARATVLQ